MRALFYVRTNFPQIFWQQIPTLLVISHYSTLVWNLHFFLQKNLQMQQFAHFRKASAWLWSVTNHYLFPAK